MTGVYIPILLRKAVIERAGGRCEYCQLPSLYLPVVFEIEHIRPVSAGGSTSLSNLALSCPACNRYKGSRQSGTDPETGQDVPLFNPRSQQWKHHFEWRDDFTLIIGITATGRATVATLRLNRPAVRRFRTALRAIGQYPGLISDEW